MYVIYKDNRRTYTKRVFMSYDEARCFIRRILRERFPLSSKTWWDYSNPRLHDFGYSIKKV